MTSPSFASAVAPPLAPPDDAATTPCFFWAICQRNAAIEKAGRSVCLKCADRLRGYEYPLRRPSVHPLYPDDRAVAEALGLAGDEGEPRTAARRRAVRNFGTIE